MPTPPDIFGAKIAQLINNGLGSLVFDQVLIKVSSIRDPSDPTKTIETEVSHNCKGFIDVFKDDQIDGTLILQNDRKIVILGASIEGGVTPEPGDKITAESEDFVIVPKGVKRDPAGATYECQSR